MKSVRILVVGRVQGVGFRQFVKSRAAVHGIHGWVKNLPGGEVECQAEADEEPLDRFLADLRKGPSLSKVDRLHVETTVSTGASRFEITF